MSQNKPVGINTQTFNIDSIVKMFTRKNYLIYYYKSLVTIKNTILFDIKLVLTKQKHRNTFSINQCYTGSCSTSNLPR